MDQNPNESQSTPKQQAVDRIRQAANVLVTVKSNPSVDELAACIGFTLMLNKLGKHATAVFSGQVPSTLEFLKPDETLEDNTDSLRDFIISLDKSKADKLRYKVEENVVRIFITPYRTSISEKDLEFTQGDFNVDVVVALGVTQREELDQAITAHGRILHDAAVIAMTAGQRESSLGTINWQEAGASSLCEMLVSISEAFQGGLIDAQMATAFLTGIVAETERFSNPKTTPKVMTMSAQLMAAGANQQLIANELQKDGSVSGGMSVQGQSQPAQSDEGTSLEIPHGEQATQDSNVNQGSGMPISSPEPFLKTDTDESFNPLMPPSAQPVDQGNQPSNEPPMQEAPPEPDDQIRIDNEGNLVRQQPQPKHKSVAPISRQDGKDQEIQELPEDNQQDTVPPSVLPPLPQPSQSLAVPQITAAPPQVPAMQPSSAPTAPQPVNNTLEQIEESVHSPHLDQATTSNTEIDSARNAVMDAISQAGYDPTRPEPRADVGASIATPIQQPPAGQPTPFGDLRLPTPEQPLAGQPPQPPMPPVGTTPPPPNVPPPFIPGQ